MARYFKFRSIDELRSECHRLGLELQLSDDLSPLFRSATIDKLRAGNSLCIQPMEGCDGTLEGLPDELTIRRYQRFGAGGAKIIWGEATAVVPEGRANARQLLLNESTAPAFAQLLRQCREAHRSACGSDDDLIVGLQLTHSGRYSHKRPLLAFHDPVLDPRTVVDRYTGKVADEGYPLLDDEYLRRLPDFYVSAARLAHQAGFQFVDIKQCHRYLLNELLAARSRPGQYGGSLDNRTRLAREIIKRIRTEVPELVIATRLNVYDSIPFRTPDGGGAGVPCQWQAPLTNSWGTAAHDPTQADLTEPRLWIAEMMRLGVAMVNISMGNPYATPHIIRPYEYAPPDGYETPEHPLIGVNRHFRLAAELQAAFPTMPMVGSGYSYLQEFFAHAGAANVREGRITIVGAGRAAFSQPDFARQLETHGKLDRKRVCRTFSYCTALMRSKKNDLGQFPTGCPPFDKEVYGPIWEQAKSSDEPKGQDDSA